MLDGHSAVLWSGNVYVWGGKEFDGPNSHAARRGAAAAYSSTMYVLNPSDCISKPSVTLQRLRLGDEGGGSGVGSHQGASSAGFVPGGRAFHNSVLYGKLMLVTGGLTEESEQSTDLSSVPAFDLERRVWAVKASFGDVPCARCHHVSVIYGDTLFVHGGYPVLNDRNRELSTEEVGSIQHAMYEAHELNISTMRWRRIHTQHSPSLWGHSAILYNKNIVVFGGVDVVENCEAGSVAVWHTEKKQWRWADFENLELRCALHSAIQDGGRMFVFSGISFKSHNKLRSLYEFNLEFGSWRELSPKGAPPLGRVGHCAVVYNQCMIVIGGTVENPADPSSTANGLPERAVHLYNTSLNEWRTCALVPASSEMADVEGEHSPRFARQEKSWSSRNLDPSVQGAVKEEWDNTAQQVKETIARARAIQSLADAATTSQNIQQQQQHQNGSPSQNQQQIGTPGGMRPLGNNNNKNNNNPHSGGGRSGSGGGGGGLNQSYGSAGGDLPVVETMIPFDDNRRTQQQQQGAFSPVNFQQMRSPESLGGTRDVNTPFGGTQTDGSPAEQAIERVVGLRQGLGNEESRRVVEQLQKENERLRMQLEEVRSVGDPKNPYEVPMFNATSTVLAADEGVNTAGGGHRLGQNNLGDNIPRLNLNASEPPRAVAGVGGFMGRGAVSALVQSSLNDVSATSTLASLQPPNSGLGTRSLDPMSFLTQPTYAAGGGAGGGGQSWHPNTYQPPQNYDQLLARSNIEMTGAHQTSTSVPLALQPLLPLLSGSTPSLNTGHSYNVQGGGGSMPLGGQHTQQIMGGQQYHQPQQQHNQQQQQQQQQGYQQQQQQGYQQQNASPQQQQEYSSASHQSAPTSRASMGGTPSAKAPSLNRLVAHGGQGSMLSLPGSKRYS